MPAYAVHRVLQRSCYAATSRLAQRLTPLLTPRFALPSPRSLPVFLLSSGPVFHLLLTKNIK